MTPSQVAALKELDALLASIPEQNFNLGVVVLEKPECGTVCCVAGWATQTKAAIDRGFSLMVTGGAHTSIRFDGRGVSWNDPRLGRVFGFSDDAWYGLTTPGSDHWRSKGFTGHNRETNPKITDVRRALRDLQPGVLPPC